MFNAYQWPGYAWFRRLRLTGIIATITMPLFGISALIVTGVLLPYLSLAPDGTLTGTAQHPVAG